MSSTLNPPRTATRRPVTFLFVVAVVVFLLAGLVIVIGQAALLIGADAAAARALAETMAPVAFGGASAAGILSFLLSYGPTPETDDDD